MCQTTSLPPRPHAKKKSTPRKPVAAPLDPWHDWQPQWHGKKTGETPHSLQERHAPTVAVTMRISAERADYVCQRRMLDARLWDSLPREAQDAATDIAASYEALTRGMGAATSNWARATRAPYQMAMAA